MYAVRVVSVELYCGSLNRKLLVLRMRSATHGPLTGQQR